LRCRCLFSSFIDRGIPGHLTHGMTVAFSGFPSTRTGHACPEVKPLLTVPVTLVWISISFFFLLPWRWGFFRLSALIPGSYWLGRGLRNLRIPLWSFFWCPCTVAGAYSIHPPLPSYAFIRMAPTLLPSCRAARDLPGFCSCVFKAPAVLRF